MSGLVPRNAVAWPAGDNSSDTIITGHHLNLTALKYWNYTLYSNGTLNNGSHSNCLLTLSPYEPTFVYANGSFNNYTSCYSPIKPLGTRGKVSIALACLYGIALMFTLLNLAKHGRMYLPTEKRFRPVGRRWQWYWMILMCATGFISLICNIDVDRYYLPNIPIILTSFFWMLLNLTTMACVWEAIRHWGSWMERQYIDPDPFALAMDDKRAQFEFWAPLFYYLWWWLDFFLVIPRNWGNVQMQRTVEQTRTVAAPSATDARFKAAVFMLLACWLTIVYYLRHSIKHYRERNRGVINRAIGLVKFTPYRFMFLVPLTLFMVAFQGLSAWQFHYGVFDVTGNTVSMFVGGYVPALLIMLVQIVAGFLNPNEDKELIRQRRVRGAEHDRELGISKKPAWWRRVNGDVHDNETMLERITRNVREVGGGQATAKRIDETHANRTREAGTTNTAPEIEMGQMPRAASTASTGQSGSRPTPHPPYSGRSEHRRVESTQAAAAQLLFPSSNNPTAFHERVSYISMDGPPPPPYQGDKSKEERGRPRSTEASNNNASSSRPGPAGRSESANTSNSIANPPQQIRSMLDV